MNITTQSPPRLTGDTTKDIAMLNIWCNTLYESLKRAFYAASEGDATTSESIASLQNALGELTGIVTDIDNRVTLSEESSVAE